MTRRLEGKVAIRSRRVRRQRRGQCAVLAAQSAQIVWSGRTVEEGGTGTAVRAIVPYFNAPT